MALTLPYPDLDFVPLDILTAEELNQIVANYTYISNQFPITSHNIDFTTISSNPVLIGQYIEGGVTYNRYLKRVRVTGLKDIATGSYKSVSNVIPVGTVYAVATASLQRSLGGSSRIYEIVPNYSPNGTVNALIDISRALRVYNYGGISTNDTSVDCLVDIEYGIVAS